MVEDLIELNSWAIKAPFEEVEKILLINNVQDMNVVSQNKLLKIVEEPPENLIIILISSNIDSLIPTLRSRTLQFNFKKLPDSIILDLIPEGLEDEQIILSLLNGSLINLKFITQGNLSFFKIYFHDFDINFVTLFQNRRRVNVFIFPV